jgi:hypothetical protein
MWFAARCGEHRARGDYSIRNTWHNHAACFFWLKAEKRVYVAQKRTLHSKCSVCRADERNSATSVAQTLAN